MKTPDTPISTPFTAVYTQWLESFRAMLPGSSHAAKAEDLTPRQALKQAHQEWEDEGGSCKAVPTPEVKDAPKIPF